MKSATIGRIHFFSDDPTGAWSFGFSSKDEDIGLGCDGEGDGLSALFVMLNKL